MFWRTQGWRLENYGESMDEGTKRGVLTNSKVEYHLLNVLPTHKINWIRANEFAEELLKKVIELNEGTMGARQDKTS